MHGQPGIRIGFLTTLGVNVGDEFVREGIRAILDGLDLAYLPFYVNKVDSLSIVEPREDEAEIVADKYWDCDLFIQAGAPVYWHLREGQATSLTSEWYDWMWRERILNRVRTDHPLFINLGAGSCQPWADDGQAFLNDPACVEFARATAERSELTTVRDPVASRILSSLSIPHESLPCPAFLAATRYGYRPDSAHLVGLNLMPLGAHYDLGDDFDRDSWKLACFKLAQLLRPLGKLVFICHDNQECEFAQGFAAPGERIFFSPAWRDYFQMYAACGVVVANRVHGAVCAAGFGVPSIIMGNDTRARIGDYLGLESYQSGKLEPDRVAEQAVWLWAHHNDERTRLLEIRKKALGAYETCLGSVTETLVSKPMKVRSGLRLPRVALARLEELENQSCKAFMSNLNFFAARSSLRIFTNWSKIWEYPWLWFNGLSQIDWRGRRLLDCGSELSPLPWFLATLGARVTLVEREARYVLAWEALKAKLNVDVNWYIVSDEGLPLADGSAEVVTSLSVIEHQVDKRKAIDEVARILEPGGLFAFSFDVCEPSMGMTFPAWNGQAMSTSDFEELVWRHPQFDSGNQAPEWNITDCASFIAWHLQSAPHHNYTVGAAVIKKKRRNC